MFENERDEIVLLEYLEVSVTQPCVVTVVWVSADGEDHKLMVKMQICNELVSKRIKLPVAYEVKSSTGNSPPQQRPKKVAQNLTEFTLLNLFLGHFFFYRVFHCI